MTTFLMHASAQSNCPCFSACNCSLGETPVRPEAQNSQKSEEIAAKVSHFMISNYVKLVVFVPITHADKIREVLGQVGAGTIKNYTFCTFSTKGTARYKEGSGAVVAVEEERIETIVKVDRLGELLKRLREAHPYKVMGFDVIPMLKAAL